MKKALISKLATIVIVGAGLFATGCDNFTKRNSEYVREVEKLEKKKEKLEAKAEELIGNIKEKLGELKKPKISIKTSSDGIYDIQKRWYDDNQELHISSLHHNEWKDFDFVQNYGAGKNLETYLDRRCDGEVERVEIRKEEGDITREKEYTKERDGESSPEVFEEGNREFARIRAELLPYLNE